ncbi:MAG: ABC transporter permease [Deltaproteobacteria bacterium]|nr:ABC transporter permease [Deltaproteobacteria bacterium]
MIPFWLARRYLWSPGGRLFARALTGLAIGSVALAVFALTTVSGVFLGFEHHLEEKLLGFQPHLMVRARDGAETAALADAMATWAARHPEVRVVPVVEGEAVAQLVGKEGFADVGVRVRGVSPEALMALAGAEWFFSPRWVGNGGRSAASEALSFDKATGTGGLVVGSEILATLGVVPDEHESVRLVAPLGLIDPAGNLQPSVRVYHVSGFFRTGLYQQDNKLVFIANAEAERLLGPQANAVWFVHLTDASAAPAMAASLRPLLGLTARVETWEEQNKKLFAALALERVVVTLLLGLTIGIASVSVLGVVLMQVQSRQRDLAILTAMGASRRLLSRVVLALGGLIGGVGSVLGGTAALALAAWCARHPIYLPETFYLETLPIEVRPATLLAVAVAAIAITMGSAWYPACVAARLDPAAGLRGE